MSTIRTATPSDLAAIERIVREAYAPYVERIGKPPAPIHADYAALIDEGVVEAADDEQGVAGFVVLLLHGDDALLDNVAVASRARGRGIGRKLIARAEQTARSKGFDRIVLYTNEAMIENLTLYPRLGYVETHRITENGLNRVYFFKALRAAE